MKDEKSGRSLKLLELQELGVGDESSWSCACVLGYTGNFSLPVGHPAAPRGVKRAERSGTWYLCTMNLDENNPKGKHRLWHFVHLKGLSEERKID